MTEKATVTMFALPQDDHLTEAEYLALERESDIRHEYIDGCALAMTGASEAHIDIVSSLHFLLYGALRKRPCKVYQLDMRVKVAQTYTYPDITVICGERHFMPDEPVATLLNPTLLIEVLSPSTEATDRGKKFHAYQKIASLQDYVLVSQNAPRIECFSRGQDDAWILTTAAGLDASVTLPAIDITLALREVYEQVDFAE